MTGMSAQSVMTNGKHPQLMIYLEDDFLGPFLIGQVSCNSYLPSKKINLNTCARQLGGIPFSSPVHSGYLILRDGVILHN